MSKKQRKQLRKNAGYETQEALAKDLNVSQSAVSIWEKTGNARPNTYRNLSKLLKVDAKELM